MIERFTELLSSNNAVVLPGYKILARRRQSGLELGRLDKQRIDESGFMKTTERRWQGV